MSMARIPLSAQQPMLLMRVPCRYILYALRTFAEVPIIGEGAAFPIPPEVIDTARSHTTRPDHPTRPASHATQILVVMADLMYAL